MGAGKRWKTHAVGGTLSSEKGDRDAPGDYRYNHNRLEIILGNDKMAGSPRKRKIDRQNETDIPAANHCLYRWRLVFVHIRAAKANPEMVCEFEKVRQAACTADHEAQERGGLSSLSGSTRGRSSPSSQLQPHARAVVGGEK